MNREVTAAQQPRTPLQVMFSVWHALFMREAVARLMAGRLAWLWLLLEPMAHALFLAVLFGFFIGRTMPGVDYMLFVMAGLMVWKLFNVTMTRCMNAVNANEALFSYKQVKPVDAVIVRAFLEGFLLLAVFCLLMVIMTFVGKYFLPADPSTVLGIALLLWLLGFGLGLVLSVMTTLVPDSDRLINIIMLPAYFVSGVMYPVMLVPEPYRGWLLLNPVANGMELLRAGYFGGLHAAPGASTGYLALWALAAVGLGLALHARYERQLVMKT